jgi:hypothetical protein
VSSLQAAKIDPGKAVGRFDEASQSTLSKEHWAKWQAAVYNPAFCVCQTNQYSNAKTAF